LSTAFGLLLKNCENLRKIEIDLIKNPIDPETIESLIFLPNLEKFRYRCFEQIVSPDYVEKICEKISFCSKNLIEINFFFKIYEKFKNSKIGQIFDRFSDSRKFRSISLEFQLFDEFLNRIDESFWTFSILSPIIKQKNLISLKLAFFDFREEKVVELFRSVGPNLKFLALDANFFLDDFFLEKIFDVFSNLENFSISENSFLSCSGISNFLVKCPKLSQFHMSTCDHVSFKQLVLAIHYQLHNCGREKNQIFGSQSLALNLGTAMSLILDEAKDLRNLNVCGLVVPYNEYSRVTILKYCPNI